MCAVYTCHNEAADKCLKRRRNGTDQLTVSLVAHATLMQGQAKRSGMTICYGSRKTTSRLNKKYPTMLKPRHSTQWHCLETRRSLSCTCQPTPAQETRNLGPLVLHKPALTLKSEFLQSCTRQIKPHFLSLLALTVQTPSVILKSSTVSFTSLHVLRHTILRHLTLFFCFISLKVST
jgi:hypothetical protein